MEWAQAGRRTQQGHDGGEVVPGDESESLGARFTAHYRLHVGPRPIHQWPDDESSDVAIREKQAPLRVCSSQYGAEVGGQDGGHGVVVARMRDATVLHEVEEIA